MKLRVWFVDAFARGVFRGNPAAVVPLQSWLADSLMQSIAAENNLSETAFFVPRADGDQDLRWFTPACEVPLCGHATLASAFIVFSELDVTRTSVRFHTASGVLEVRKGAADLLEMDFPRRMPSTCAPPADLLAGLRATPLEVLATDNDTNFYAVFDSEQAVRAIAPDFAALTRLHPHGVAVTAPGEEADFVSRYFVPSYGIPEDPVTGSTHCALVPFWAQRLGKTRLRARQVSRRGGDLDCEDRTGRVSIAGRAVKYLDGTIAI